MPHKIGSKIKSFASKLIHGDRISYVKPTEPATSVRNQRYGKAMQGAFNSAKSMGAGVGGQAPKSALDKAITSKFKTK